MNDIQAQLDRIATLKLRFVGVIQPHDTDPFFATLEDSDGHQETGTGDTIAASLIDAQARFAPARPRPSLRLVEA